MQLSIAPRGMMRFLSSALLALIPFSPLCWAQAQSNSTNQAQSSSNQPIVFLIVLENKNSVGTGGVYGSSEAPYINKTLFPMAAVANNYFNPSGNHPSLPNYLWMEAGQSFGIRDDGPPSQHQQGTHAHLSTLLQNAGIPWRAYAESISGNVCPLTAEGGGLYQTKHLPYVYFTDVTNGGNPHSSYCIQHVRPLSELGSAINSNAIGRYNFITPNMCHDGHDSCGGNEVAHIDGWLRSFLPQILNSAQYKAGHVTLFIVTDEAANGDGPIPFLVLGHGVKRGYKNEIRYTHSSLLRTLEEIFGVSPLLGNAARANDLRDLFTALP
jgi:phosphatidylinositol-3-phosphatase